jgi:uncharacterized membrane protein YuzA (DUF378 family)
MSDEFWQTPADFLSLVMILLAGIELGLLGAFGFSLLGWLFGSWRSFAYDAVGVSAVWQFFRQRPLG